MLYFMKLAEVTEAVTSDEDIGRKTYYSIRK